MATSSPRFKPTPPPGPRPRTASSEPPRSESAWQDSTRIRLKSARALRYTAAGHLLVSATPLETLELRREECAKKKSKMRRKVEFVEATIRSILERAGFCQQVARALERSMPEMLRIQLAVERSLHIVERRLELRTARPVQERVADYLQKALEEERRILLRTKQAVLDRTELSKNTMTDLENVHGDMAEEMRRKKLSLRSGVRGSENAGRECGAGRAEVALPHLEGKLKLEGADSSKLLERALGLEVTAERLLRENEAFLRNVMREADQARAITLNSIRRRINETIDLKTALERELRETDNAIIKLESGHTETERLLVTIQESMKADVAEAQASKRNNSDAMQRQAQADLHEERVLQERLRKSKHLLDQLVGVRKSLQEDLRWKAEALQIEEACSKVFGRPQSAIGVRTRGLTM